MRTNNFEYDELSRVKIARILSKVVALEVTVKSDVAAEGTAKKKALELLDHFYLQVKLAIQLEQIVRMKNLKQNENIEG